MQYLGAISKMTEWLVRFQGKPFNITIIQVYAPITNAEEDEIEWFYEDLLEKAMAPHSSTLAWKIPWMEEPGGLPSMGSYRVGHNWSDLAAAAAAWRFTRPYKTNTKKKKKRCPFHHRGLECKNRKLRDTWSNRQVWPWSTEWSRAKTNRVLPREHTGS